MSATHQKTAFVMPRFSFKWVMALFFSVSTASSFAQRAQVNCPGTIAAWQSDVSMRRFMSEHDCDCRNGTHSSPVCVRRSTGGRTAAPAKSRSTGTYTVRKKKSLSTNQMMQKAFVEGLSKGMQVDPAAEAARRREAAENAKRLDAAHQAEVQAVEAQRLQAARRQAVSRKVHGQELSQALQGLPGTQDRGLALSMPGNTSQGLSAGRQLKSAVFHGERALQAASPEAMRDEASRGFDQPGQHAGRLVKPVPKPVNLENIPSEKMTPKIKQFVDERAANRKKKQAAEEKLATLRAKQKLEPNETVEVVKLQQEISTAQNKENYYNFSINEALTKPASDGK